MSLSLHDVHYNTSFKVKLNVLADIKPASSTKMNMCDVGLASSSVTVLNKETQGNVGVTP